MIKGWSKSEFTGLENLQNKRISGHNKGGIFTRTYFQFQNNSEDSKILKILIQTVP